MLIIEALNVSLETYPVEFHGKQKSPFFREVECTLKKKN